MELMSITLLKMKLVSSCLIGLCATWRAKDNSHSKLVELMQSGKAIPVCPEQMGGLSTPRAMAEIVGGNGEDVLDGRARVMTREGEDVTSEYIRGAEETLKIARMVKPEEIILKENSPSCGVRWIYDGTFKGNLIGGSGVTTALLRRHGFTVVSDQEFEAASGAEDPNLYL
jgi:uncharacterized protein YbbK (DUF523 family)